MKNNQDPAIKLWTLGLFAMATMAIIVASFFRVIDSIAFPFLLLLLPFVLLFGLWTVLTTAQLLATGVAVVTLCLIDFGLGGLYAPLVLSFKGIAYGFCLVIGLQFLLRSLPRLGPIEWSLLVYVLFAWGSAFYSKDQFTSFYTGFALVALGLMSIRLGYQTPSQLDRYLTIAGQALSFTLGLSLIFYLVFPQLAISATGAGGGRVGGLFGSPNAASGVAGVAVVLNFAVLIWPTAGSRWTRPLALIGLAISITALQLSGGRNAFFSSLLACGLVMGLRWPRTMLLAISAGAVAVLVVTVLDAWKGVMDFAIGLVARQRDGFDIQNLTGRTEIWAFVLEQWKASPWLGYGLAGSRTVISEGYASFWGKTTGTAHNALLESLLDLGVLGALLLFTYIALLLVAAVRSIRTGSGGAPSANAGLCILAFVLLFGITEKSFAGTPSTATGALFLAGALVSSRLRRTAVTKESYPARLQLKSVA